MYAWRMKILRDRKRINYKFNKDQNRSVAYFKRNVIKI